MGTTSLLPFYPSPLRDDGYDITVYSSVHSSYGTLDDFKVFLREAHQRGLRVITELVMNHTSDQHPWFQRGRRAHWRFVTGRFKGRLHASLPTIHQDAQAGQIPRAVFEMRHAAGGHGPIAGGSCPVAWRALRKHGLHTSACWLNGWRAGSASQPKPSRVNPSPTDGL